MTDEYKASKSKGFAWLAGTIVIAALFAFGIAPIVRMVPWAWEKQMADWVAAAPSDKICLADPKKEALLKKLVGRIFPVQRDDAKISIDVRIVDDDSVNAFAELGGQISVNRGLLDQAESADEIAGVLAHEMEHVRHRHVLEGVVVHLLTIGGLQMIFSSQAGVEWSNFFLSMNFTRGQEAEADEGALLRLQKANVSNEGFKHFFQRMESSSAGMEFLSDHPSNRARIHMAEKFENKDTTPVMTRAEWKTFKGYCK